MKIKNLYIGSVWKKVDEYENIEGKISEYHTFQLERMSVFLKFPIIKYAKDLRYGKIYHIGASHKCKPSEVFVDDLVNLSEYDSNRSCFGLIEMCDGIKLLDLAPWTYFPKIYPIYKRQIANKYSVDEKSIYNQKIINKPLHKCKRYNR